MTVAPMTCERCGEPLERSYSTTAYAGVAQTLQVGPDGASVIFPRGGMVACSWGCLAVLAAQRAGASADAAVKIVAERERQVTAEGYSPDHDASHPAGELAVAGAFYALGVARGDGPLVDPGVLHHDPEGPDLDRAFWRWPWEGQWWKPKTPERDLIRAGALIAAELDRLRRHEPDPEPF